MGPDWEFDPVSIGLKILLLLFILFIVLLIHELGHFFAARVFGVKVRAVAIGRGRTICKKPDRRGTLWTFGWVPFGAHVSLEGLETRPYIQRVLTILAGPLVNLVLPFILFTGFYIAVGQPSAPPVIVGVEKGLAAEKAGLKPGDRVLEVNGVKIESYKDLWREAYENGNSRHGVREGRYKIRRGEREFEITMQPEWSEYFDDAIARANARFGIFWTHAPFSLKYVHAVNGEDVKGKPGRARELFVKNFDRPMTVELKGPDEGPYIYKVLPQRVANPHITDKDHKDYKNIYLGQAHGNFYLRRDLETRTGDAIKYSFDCIVKIARLPLQLLPIDPYALKDPDSVHNPETWLANAVYGFLHKLAMASVIIGMINLLPLPYLDGGHVLTQGIEAARGRSLSRKASARLFAAMFLILYLSVFLANSNKLPRYIDSRLKKVHEYMTQNH